MNSILLDFWSLILFNASHRNGKLNHYYLFFLFSKKFCSAFIKKNRKFKCSNLRDSANTKINAWAEFLIIYFIFLVIIIIISLYEDIHDKKVLFFTLTNHEFERVFLQSWNLKWLEQFTEFKVGLLRSDIKAWRNINLHSYLTRMKMTGININLKVTIRSKSWKQQKA